MASNSIAMLNSVRYRGYVYDSETGLYYLQSRYYDPETGRFLNADDVDFVGAGEEAIAYNAFAYCGNNPIRSFDYEGNIGISIIIKAISKVAIGLLIQYAQDVLTNICNGKTGKNIFKRVSKWSTYVSVAINSVIPGNKIFSRVSKSIVSTACETVEDYITADSKPSLKTVIKKR